MPHDVDILAKNLSGSKRVFLKVGLKLFNKSIMMQDIVHLFGEKKFLFWMIFISLFCRHKSDDIY